MSPNWELKLKEISKTLENIFKDKVDEDVSWKMLTQTGFHLTEEDGRLRGPNSA